MMQKSDDTSVKIIKIDNVNAFNLIVKSIYYNLKKIVHEIIGLSEDPERPFNPTIFDKDCNLVIKCFECMNYLIKPEGKD